MSSYVEMLVQLFVKKEKRARILALAAKANRRSDLVRDLLHDTRSLDPATLAPLATHTADVETVARALRAAGAGRQAYCISAILAADDRELDLREALELVVGNAEDSLVFAIGSNVAYYEDHDGAQYVLRR